MTRSTNIKREPHSDSDSANDLAPRLQAAKDRASALETELKEERRSHTNTLRTLGDVQNELTEAKDKLKHEQEAHNKTKESLQAREVELGQAKEALTAENERAHAAEKRLAQENATLKIENTKRKLAELYNEKVNTTDKKKKRELELELSTEEWRLDDLTEESKEK